MHDSNHIRAQFIHHWMNLNPDNDWVQRVGSIWLGSLIRRRNCDESAQAGYDSCMG
jgi:hypothetical protein